MSTATAAIEWECVRSGLHVGTIGDQEWHVERGWGSYTCKGPHPLHGGGFCRGEIDHDDVRGWTLMRRSDAGDGFEILDRFQLLRDAKAWAERLAAA